MTRYIQEKRKPYKTERKSNLTEVSQIMEALKKTLGLDENFFAVSKVWDKEVGVDNVGISGYKNGVIFAETQYSTALHEVTIRKKEIIKKLNQYIGSNKIKDIKIKIV